MLRLTKISVTGFFKDFPIDYTISFSQKGITKYILENDKEILFCYDVINFLEMIRRFILSKSISEFIYFIPPSEREQLELTITCKDSQEKESNYNIFLVPDKKTGFQIFSESITYDGNIVVYIDQEDINIGTEFNGDEDFLLDLYSMRKKQGNWTQFILTDWESFIYSNQTLRYIFKGGINFINLEYLLSTYGKTQSDVVNYLRNNFTNSILSQTRTMLPYLFSDIDKVDEEFFVIKQGGEYKLEIQKEGSGFRTLVFLLPYLIKSISDRGNFLGIVGFINNIHPLLKESLIHYYTRNLRENSQLFLFQ